MSSPAGCLHFLDHPGQAGAFGALMDEYARAADDFCTAVEGIPADAFAQEVASPEPDTASIAAVCRHVVASAYGYANAIRRARDLPRSEPGSLDGVLSAATAPAEVRPRLGSALRHMEGAVAGLADDEAMAALRFAVPWGPTYDPEMLLEHAIVHLLRHRRQIERWPGVRPQG